MQYKWVKGHATLDPIRDGVATVDQQVGNDRADTAATAGIACSFCAAPATRRCRLCRAVGYCGARCAAEHAACHRSTHAMRCIVLPSELDPDFESSFYFEPVDK